MEREGYNLSLQSPGVKQPGILEEPGESRIDILQVDNMSSYLFRYEDVTQDVAQ